MKTSIDFIKHRSAFWRLFALAAFLPVAAGAYSSGETGYNGYVNSYAISGITWLMGAKTMGNNGTASFPTAVALRGCTYSDASKVANLSIPRALLWDSHGSAGAQSVPVTSITAGAFRNCSHITSVTIPSSVTTINLPCFKGCSSLTSINVAGGLEYASENGILFKSYMKTKLVKYPEGKTGSSYTVPQSVTELADSCFANTKLSTIVFSGSPPPTVASTAFSGSSASVLYPQGASGWTSPWNGVNTYAIPNAVTGLKATQGTSQTQVTVTWTANAVAKSYVVYRAESTGGSKVTLGTIGSGSTVFSDTTATAGKTYYYWVKAVNGPAESGLGSYVQGWKAGSYTVTLDAQGGTGGTASVTATYGSSMPAIAVPSRLGYTFGGYYTSTGGGGTQYYTASGTSARTWDKTAATTLYAKWTGNSYTVTLDAQSGSGGTASVTATYGSAMPNVTIPARADYTFGGYFSEPGGGGTQYYTAVGTSARAWDVAAAATLYAKWTGSPYTVTLDARGGTGGTASVTANYGAAMPKITIPTRANYTFGGYYSEPDGGGTQYYTATGTSARAWDVSAAGTLYAKWTGTPCSVTLDAQGGSGGMASVTANYGEAMPSIVLPSRTGYMFGGYYTAANGGGTQYYTADGSSTRNWDKTAATTLYAKWTGNPYTVMLDPQGGSGGTPAVTATYGEAMPSIAVPSLVDLVFNGYYSESDGGGTQYYTAFGTSAHAWDQAADGTLCAQWLPAPTWIYTLSNGTATVTGVAPAAGASAVPSTLAIPGTLGGCPVASIGSNAFSNCTNLTAVTIPATVACIEGGAFSGCTQLQAVHIHDLAAWCGIMFQDSSANPLSCAKHLYLAGEEVTELVIPDSVTKIGSDAFRHCAGLTSVTIPNSVTNIGERAFDCCTGLRTSVVIPDSVTDIGGGAFYGCTGLASVVLSGSVGSINWSTFCNCSDLTALVIPDNVMEIAHYAFGECRKLTNVVIGTGVTDIGWRAFYRCTALATLTIPGNVKRVGEEVFEGCTGLKQLFVPASWKGTDILANAEVPNGCSIVYYEWDGVVTVAFDANGGSCTSRSGKYTVGEPFGNLPTAWREGHRFSGWWTTAAEGVQVGTDTVVDGAAILYARWTANTYAVTLDAQGGTGGTASVPATYGEAVPSIGVPAREGYTFGGYYTSTNGTGTQYYTDRGTSARTWDRTDATTLYAAWTPNTYTISLDAQGGSNGTASVAATYGEAMPTIAVPVREGYAFGGYYTSTGGSGTQYYAADGAGVRAWDRTAATTLHAVWKPLAVATPVITPADGSVFVEETCEVSIGCATEGAAIYYTTDGTTPRIAEAFRYTAPFTLSGTATVKAVASVDGLKSGYAAATITRRILTLAEAAGAPNLAFTTGGIAEWKPVVDGLAGNGFAAQSGKIPPNGETWLEVSVSGPGTFRFDWKVDCEADDSGNATWDRLSASVDGGERLRIDGTTGWASVAFPLEGSGEHIIRWTFSKDGYDEEGAACSDRAWVSGVAWEPEDEPRTAAVAFDAHGGSCAVESREYTVGEPYGELPEAVRPGYTFAGWWTAAAGGTRVGTDTVADAATTVLHARWTANTYVVTLDAQGGTGGTSSVVATFDKALPAIGIPSRPECVFGGYFPETDGRGTPYYGADGQGTRTWDVAGDATLYAKWTATTHTQTVAGVKWFYAVSDGMSKVTGANPAEGRLEIPSELGGYPVADIGDRAFAGCLELTGVRIPGSVTNIGSGAFDCCGLAEVTIPGSVKCIGGAAFSWCEELTNVVIGAGVAVIGAGAFEYCAALVAVTIPDGVTNLGARLFEGCRGLTSVTIGNGVKNIPDFAFNTCTALTNVVIGNSVTHIGHAAFAGCNGLEVLVVPCNVESVVGAFEYSLLKGLYVPAAWKETDMLQNAMVPHGCAVLYTLSSTAFTIPAGGMTPVSVPYWNLGSADGSFKFGETGIAAGLPAGSAVYFWDEGKQKWGGGMKSAFGWDPAESNRVLLPGEGFCVRNGGAEAVEVAAVGEIPSDESLVRAYRGGGEWTFVAYPYPCGEDIQFGATELAMQLGKGASVMFWDASVQGWYTYSKSAKGWSSAGASRVLGEGEAFFVQSAPDDADGTWTVCKPDDYP